MATCGATPGNHCCWLGIHGQCQHLNVETARCTIRERKLSWSGVHTDPVYLADVKPKLTEIGVTVDCGEWPTLGITCHTCGVEG